MIKHQSTGDFEPVATTDHEAHAITTGRWAHAMTAGDNSPASTASSFANAMTAGDNANASTTGRNSIAAALGDGSKAKAGEGGWIVLAAYSEDGELLHVRTGQVGKDVRPNVWYSLSREGRFIEHQDKEAQQGGQPS